MQNTSINTVVYAPGIPPNDPAQLPLFLTQELTKLQAAIQALAAGHLDQSNVAPGKPRDGDLRYADGSNWNPGSGEGFYGYYGGSWHLLG